MLYPVFKTWDTSGKPIIEWECDCEQCKNSTSPCLDVLHLNLKSTKKRFVSKFEYTLFKV